MKFPLPKAERAPTSGTEAVEKTTLTYNIFSVDSAEIDWKKAAEQNKQTVERESKFDTKIRQILDGENKSPEEKLVELRKFTFEDNSPSSLNPSELMLLLNTFKDHFENHADWESIIKLYNGSNDERFTSAPLVREFYAVALNKSGNAEASIKEAERLISEGVETGEMMSALGKAYKLRYEAAKAMASTAGETDGEKFKEAKKNYLNLFPEDTDLNQVNVHFQQSFEKAFLAYEKGYLLDFEYYPGINAVYLALEIRTEEWDQKAHEMAKLVKWSAENDGGLDAQDYWTAITTLEAMCIMHDDAYAIEAGLAKVLPRATKVWQIDTTLEHLNKLPEFPAKGIVTTALEQRITDIKAGTALEAVTQENVDTRDDATKKIDAHSYNLRGLNSNFVSGNFEFNGQLHDRTINRSDVTIFDKLVQKLDLNKVETLEEFNEITDEFIRFNYGTEQMENLLGQYHKLYDNTVKDLIAWAGIDERKGANSRTSISVDLLLGLGDCRHHADAKQMLFDRWQRGRVNQTLRSSYDKIRYGQNNEQLDFDSIAHSIESIRKHEMRTFHVIVSGPLRTKGKYEPVFTDKGHFLLDESGIKNDIEDHTMTMLLERDENGNIVGIKLADSFYQLEYPFHQGEVSPENILGDGFEVVLPVENSAGEIVETTIYLKPTAYSNQKSKPDQKYYGELLLRGHAVSSKNIDLEKQFTPSGRSNARKNLVGFRKTLPPAENIITALAS